MPLANVVLTVRIVLEGCSREPLYEDRSDPPCRVFGESKSVTGARKDPEGLKTKNALKSSPGACFEALSTDFESSRQGASFWRIPRPKNDSQGMFLLSELKDFATFHFFLSFGDLSFCCILKRLDA